MLDLNCNPPEKLYFNRTKQAERGIARIGVVLPFSGRAAALKRVGNRA